MYEWNYFHITIAEGRSEGIEVAERPTVQGAKRRDEGTKGWSICWEEAEGPFLEVSGASFVKAKEKSEVSGFDRALEGDTKWEDSYDEKKTAFMKAMG